MVQIVVTQIHDHHRVLSVKANERRYLVIVGVTRCYQLCGEIVYKYIRGIYRG